MPDAQVLDEGVDAVPATRSTRRRVVGLAGASALAFTALRLPKANGAGAQDVSAQARRTYVNNNPIDIRDQNTAIPYPSQIRVSNMPGAINGPDGVKVRIRGFSHQRVRDVQIALVSPTGTAVWLMGGVGGTAAVTGLNLLIFDSAPNTFPDSSFNSGSYRPRKRDDSQDNNFPPPAPRPITSTSLNDFSGLAGDNLNGNWKLFVRDSEPLAAGTISGWELDLTTTNSKPKARNDRYSTRQNKKLRVRKPGVLKNDKDVDDDKLVVVNYDKRSKLGSIRIRKTGALVFRPKKDKKGKATFQYTVEDPFGEKSTAKVIITVK